MFREGERKAPAFNCGFHCAAFGFDVLLRAAGGVRGAGMFTLRRVIGILIGFLNRPLGFPMGMHC